MYSIVCSDSPIIVSSFTTMVDTREDIGGCKPVQHQQIIYSITVRGILFLVVFVYFASTKAHINILNINVAPIKLLFMTKSALFFSTNLQSRISQMYWLHPILDKNNTNCHIDHRMNFSPKSLKHRLAKACLGCSSSILRLRTRVNNGLIISWTLFCEYILIAKFEKWTVPVLPGNIVSAPL